MNCSTTVLYSQKLISNCSFKNVIVLFRRNGFVFTINHWLFQFGKLGIDAVQWFFHFVYDFIKIVDCLLSLFDKVINSRWLPLELFDTRLDVFVHFYNSFLNERLLDIIEASNNSVIILDDEFKWNNLSSVNVSLLEQFRSSLRNTSIKLFEIFNLTK